MLLIVLESFLLTAITGYFVSILPLLAAKAPQVINAAFKSGFGIFPLGGQPPTVDRRGDLPYTRNVIQEAMRLYPPAFYIIRHTMADDEIGGCPIPANSIIFLMAHLVHRHPAMWEEPERFDPERFTPERSASRSRFAYIPIGGGSRICIGNSLAMMEAQLVLATVAQRYSLRLVPGHPVEPQMVFTTRPRHGCP